MSNKWSLDDTGYDDGYKDGYNQALKDLLKVMKERDEDCGEPKNAVDKGYSLAYEHMCYEAEQLKK